jgi:translation initiation factor 5A
MATVDDYDFSSGDAGASHVFNSEAGQIRVGGFMVIKEHPCRVTAVSTSKTGKHGHAKCNFTALDIFTNKKYEDIIPATHTAHIPVVVRKDFDLLDITDDGFLSLMDEEGNTRDDVKLPEHPEGYARDLKLAFEASQASSKALSVSLLSAMGHEQIMSHKEVQEAEKK